MKFPVVASDGYSYERSAIIDLIKQTKPSNLVSPITRETLIPVVHENKALKKIIDSYIDRDVRLINQAFDLGVQSNKRSRTE